MTYATGRHLITTEAKPRRCRCGVWVLAGHSAGVPTSCELTPVEPSNEIRLRSAGRATYELYRGRLYLREDWGSGLPAGRVVLVEHVHD